MSSHYVVNPFSSKLHLHNQDDESSPLPIYYKGVFDPSTISEISKKIWSQYSNIPAIRHKIFAIFIELAQNVSYYSSERAYGIHFPVKNSGIGSLLIYSTKSTVVIYFSNVINKENFQTLFDRFRNISNMSMEQLRNVRKNIRENTLSEDTLGANFGLVQVALLCRNNLEVKIEEIDHEFYNFSIKSTVLF